MSLTTARSLKPQICGAWTRLSRCRFDPACRGEHSIDPRRLWRRNGDQFMAYFAPVRWQQELSG